MGKPAAGLTRAIRDYLTLRGFFCFRGGCTASRNSKGGYYVTGEKGSCDLYAIGYQGVHSVSTSEVFRIPLILGIEIKAGKDRVRPSQSSFHAEFSTHGGRVIIARSLQDVITVIEQIEKGTDA
jgi:hypothetical protein